MKLPPELEKLLLQYRKERNLMNSKGYIYMAGYTDCYHDLLPLIEALEFYAKRRHMDGLEYEMDTRPGKCGYEEDCAAAKAYDAVAEDVEDGTVAREALKIVRGEE